MEKVAIPKIVDATQRPFSHLVESILLAKANSKSADTISQENEIDRLVYELYKLSPQEIALVESVERTLRSKG